MPLRLPLALLPALIGLAAAVVFLPGRGLYPRWQYLHRMTERILLEDAVKHLYNYDYRNQTPTVESLSGALQIQGGRAAQLLIRLESSGLTKTAEEGPRLTQLGRENALRILRVHRLWERHLAEETGIGDGDWHREAELREHDLSPDEVDRLSEAMGDPVYDPHGDPIPTATGDIAPRQGRPLSVLHEGERATIVHIEDEPEDVYARLSEQGLYLGLPIQVTEVSDEHVRFMAEGHMIDAHLLGFYDQVYIAVGPPQYLVGRQNPAGLGDREVGLAHVHAVGVHGSR